MISLIHCGNAKKVYMLPSGKKLADATKEFASYMGA